MRELIKKNQRVIVVPADFKSANKGVITEVNPTEFKLDLDYEADGFLKNNYCEFYLETANGTLYFESYPKNIENKSITVANPAKHKFLQRRRFTRIKFVYDLDIKSDDKLHKITTLDISAGGMKFKTTDNIDIEKEYVIELPLTEQLKVTCKYSPIRIEKGDDGFYTHSGRFNFFENRDKMTLIQHCAKRSIEIKNK